MSIQKQSQLGMFAEDSPANPTQEQTENEKEPQTSATYQERCLRLWKVLSQPQLLGKTPRVLLILGWHPTVMRWRKLAITPRHSVYQLVVMDYLPWNGIAGLFPRPTASNAKGSPKSRYRGSKESRSNFHEVIRESPNDGTLPNPEFVEWVKGIPKSHTELKPLEMQSTQSCQKSSGEQ